METFFELRSGKIEKGTLESAAWDLFNAGPDLIIPPICKDSGSIRGCPTGVKTAFSPNLRAVIMGKSGLGLKGLAILGGLIDSDYRGEWVVICCNLGEVDLVIRSGEKVAQFILEVIPAIPMIQGGDSIVSVKSEARIGGFGSTGK